MLVLRNIPRNRYQLSVELDLDYKAIQHHLKVLEKNDLVIKTGNRYGLTYCVSGLFENNEIVFDEIVYRLKNLKSSYYIWYELFMESQKIQHNLCMMCV